MKSKWPEVQKNLYKVEQWIKQGLLEKEIAAQLGISVSTLEEYKSKHSEFAKALMRAREEVDYQVETSLFRKCVGYTIPEKQAFKCKQVYYDKQGRRCEREILKTIVVDKHVPPDTLAMSLWLNNRQPKKWRRNANKEKLDEKRFEHEKNIDGKKYW